MDKSVEGQDHDVALGKRPSGRLAKVARWIGIALLGLAALVALLVSGLNTDPGRRFLANRIGGLQFANGLQVGVGQIDGNLYGKLTIHNLTLSDPKGVFFRAPLVKLDWRPFEYVGNHVDIRSAIAPTAALLRVPAFKATPPSHGPVLPDIDITVGRLRVDRLVVEPPVTGVRRVGSIDGQAQIADGRAQIRLDAGVIAGSGRPGGDRLALRLDAVPQQNRLAINLLLDAPRDGVFAKVLGISDALALRIQGSGDWKHWNGSADANLGGSPLARLKLTARNGTFGVTGPAKLSRLAQGPTAALLGPTTQVAVHSTWQNRVAQFDGRIQSNAITLVSSGVADLGRSRLRMIRVAFQLLRPAAVAPNLSGRNVRAELTLNGALARPDVAYRIAADRIAFGDAAVIGLRGDGTAHFLKDHLAVLLSARARAITGLDSVAGGTIASVALTGDLAVDWPRILSDNLRVRSDRIDATADILANVSTGLYAGALSGRVQHYRVQSVGIFNLQSNADLKSTTKGLTLTGKVRARSTNLLNDSVKNFLGGNFVASTNFAYGPDTIVRIFGIRVNAPLLKVTDGHGTYSQSGRIAVQATGVSQKYGRVGIEITGTVDHPNATVTASNPGLGLGLSNLRAKVRSTANGYEVNATGNTDYGPVTADLLLRTSGGPLTIDIRNATLAGIDVSGQVRQAPAGPFTGQLTASGQGVSGNVRLAAAGRYQRVIAKLRARDTVLPKPANIAVGFASVDADVILYDRPQIAADVQLANATFGGTSISALRAIIEYRAGNGSARMIAEGSNGVPFHVAVNSQLQPQLWRVAVQGKVNGIGFKTASPAQIVPKAGIYELMPTRVVLDRGSILLSGAYGHEVRLQGRLDNVGLALIDAFVPGLGVGGEASGTVTFAQTGNAFPTAQAQLAVRDFTRTTASAVSQPIDINLVAALEPSRASVRAVMRTRGTVIGRLQAFADPLGPGRSWTERVSAAPVSGGIRYMGPADALFSLAGLADQSLSGTLGVAADFGCRVAAPCLHGVVRGRNLAYRNLTYGTHLTNMALSGQFSGDQLQIQQLSANAGGGTVTGSGSISLAASRGYPTNIKLRLDRARLTASDDLNVTATGDVQLVKTANAAPLLKGTVRLPSTRYHFVRQGAAEVPKLTGVHFKAPPGKPRVTGAATEPPTSAFGNVRLDLHIIAPNELYVSGMGLESEWRADLRITGASADPRIAGTIDLIRGTLSFAGRSFDLQDGRIRFLGGSTDSATISLSGTETIEDVDVALNVTGPVSNPRISFSSTPGLPQDEIMARVLFGNSVGSLSALQAVQLAASLNALRASGGGFNPLGKLRAAAGFDRLRILGADATSGRGAALAVGKYITNDIYLEVVTDARGFTATQLEVSLSRSLSVLSQVGAASGTNVSVRYRKRY